MNRRESIKTLGILSSGLVLYQCAPSLAKAEPEYFTLSYRLHPNMFTTDEEFEATNKFFQKHKSAVNELALFDETLPSAPCAPLDFVRKMAAIHAKRIRQFKAAGIPRVGINILNNLGHGNRAGIWEMPYQPMVGHDGEESLCPCPNDAGFREYLKQRYRIAAEAQPDFIWMDDDFRVIAHGVKYPCFCPICMEKFEKGEDRQLLVKRLNQPGNQDLRLAWTQFLNKTLTSLAEELTATVKAVNPTIEMGLMTIGFKHRTYGTNDVHGWSNAFQATMGRPGHGYYRDDKPRQITDKLFEVGRQVREYPASMKRIEYEQEEWPYITLNKSRSTNLNEATLALMVGCNGIANNIFYERDNTNLQEYDALLQQIGLYRPFWEKVVQASQDTQLYGFWPVDHPNLMARKEVGLQGWFETGAAYDIEVPNELSELGIPFSNNWKNSCGVLMSGRIAEAFSDEELRQMLSGAVYLDTQALEVLWQRGMGELTGVKHVNESSIAVEIFADHPFNQGMAGTMRRASGWSRGTYLEKVNDKVQAVNHLHVMTNQQRKGISLSLFENELGGRIAVSSYHPWDGLGMLAKVTQISRLMNYLSRNKMPVMLEKSYRIMPLFRQNVDGNRFVLSLFNNSLDTYENVPLSIKNSAARVKMLTPGKDEKMRISRQDKHIDLQITRIEPWSTVVIVGE